MADSINLTTITASIAILLNVFLIFLVVFIRNFKLGSLKWALVLLAGFETVFAIDLVLAPPYFVIMNGTWMAFSFGTVISESITSYFASFVYCSLHQIWVGTVSALFIYRYMVICRKNWLQYLEAHKLLKYSIFSFYIIHVFVAFWCGFSLCVHSPMTEDIRQKVINASGLDVPEKINFLHLTPKHINGWLGYLNHIFVYYGSVPIYIYCGVSMYRQTKQAPEVVAAKRGHVQMQRKMFYLVLIQTLTPLILSNLPFLVVLTFPLWPQGFIFNSTSNMMPLLTTIPKIVDPIAVIFFVSAYRRAVSAMIKCKFEQVAIGRPIATVSLISSGQPTRAHSSSQIVL